MRTVHAMWNSRTVAETQRITPRDFAEKIKDVAEWMEQPTMLQSTRDRLRRIRAVRDVLVAWIRPRNKKGRARHAPEVAAVTVSVMTASGLYETYVGKN